MTKLVSVLLVLVVLFLGSIPTAYAQPEQFNQGSESERTPDWLAKAAADCHHKISSTMGANSKELMAMNRQDLEASLAILDSDPSTRQLAGIYRQARDHQIEAGEHFDRMNRIHGPEKIQELRAGNAEQDKAKELLGRAADLVVQLFGLAVGVGVRELVRDRRKEKDKAGPITGVKPRTQPIPINPIQDPNERKRRDEDGEKCPLPRIPCSTPTTLPARISNIQSILDYRSTFFTAYPMFRPFQSNVVVHHAVGQAVLNKYPGLFTVGEMHSINNLRGICVPYRGYIHSTITASWNQWYVSHPRATRAEILAEVARIDSEFGHWFDPYLF